MVLHFINTEAEARYNVYRQDCMGRWAALTGDLNKKQPYREQAAKEEQCKKNQKSSVCDVTLDAEKYLWPIFTLTSIFFTNTAGG